MTTFLLAATLLAHPGIDSINVQIDQINRQAISAGRRGSRITENWTITVNGTSASVRFDPYHTRMASTPAFRSPGDTAVLSLNRSEMETLKSGGTVQLSINAISN
ncbi:hypothetical protein C0431_02845 [bacterium]|jgi:hypothetical protein|nr:hypothetical protein [bacterium]